MYKDTTLKDSNFEGSTASVQESPITFITPANLQELGNSLRATFREGFQDLMRETRKNTKEIVLAMQSDNRKFSKDISHSMTDLSKALTE